MASRTFRFPDTFVHLGDDGRAIPLPVTETFWPDLISGKLTPGPGRLVSFYHFESDWDSWEVHPSGDELVCLFSGAMELLLDGPEGRQSLTLAEPGAFLVVPRNTWHTARVSEPATALLVTQGAGTQHRPV